MSGRCSCSYTERKDESYEICKKDGPFWRGDFSKLAEIKKEKTAKGEEIIDLSIGAPNIPPAPHIMEALCRAAAEPSNYVYAISDRREMLEAAGGWYQTRYGVELDPETEICSLLAPRRDWPISLCPSWTREMWCLCRTPVILYLVTDRR